ncbi:cysteine desulfurase family protein [Stakelama saccharophila]|uniref:Cysteine desulfurase n=1 Tax=Stakelama saccharophila TaxID=3075605 RepID=A0ABZ0B657_9SPHN|nr:aminotransferase class V-fold PLP-dependent enzyme [Stakelama sp. W311]WNO52785.1 aminotransferase class V-fold PLP-dependent enzyme [Stakelama sp. W311]
MVAERTHLDHAATTPVRPEAQAAVAEGLRDWANPSSPHAAGRAARAALEDARARIRSVLDWDGELIFTSGATESIAIALAHADCTGRAVSAIEHDSVLRAAGDATRLPVRPNGALDMDVLAAVVGRGERPLVAVQAVNSELGTAQDLAGIAAIVRDAGGLLFADCAQSAGKVPLPDADLMAVSAHKFGGPPGIGALLVRDFAMLRATGGQEFGYRGGTENLPGALAMAAALEAADRLDDGTAAWLAELQPALLDLRMKVADQGGTVLADPGRPAAILSIAMPGMKAAAQLIRFDLAGIAVSAGSACSSGSLKTSHVLDAIRAPADLADSAIRVSVGWTTTPGDIARFAEAWTGIAQDARSRAA